jgi:putative membrane protein
MTHAYYLDHATSLYRQVGWLPAAVDHTGCDAASRGAVPDSLLMEEDVRTLTQFASMAALLGIVTAASGADKVSQVFIRDAIQRNLAEIQMGQLAQDKAQSSEVKSYGQMLVTDQSASNEQAEKVAEQIGIAAPTEPSVNQKAMYQTMSRLSGMAFDRAFIKEMIADHKMNIVRFQNEAKKKNDPAADFANQALPTLKKHLDAAQKLDPNI